MKDVTEMLVLGCGGRRILLLLILGDVGKVGKVVGILTGPVDIPDVVLTYSLL